MKQPALLQPVVRENVDTGCTLLRDHIREASTPLISAFTQ
jgi:hypothetical protein